MKKIIIIIISISKSKMKIEEIMKIEINNENKIMKAKSMKIIERKRK